MDKKMFESFEEASDYLNTHFNGHGTIVSADTGLVLRQCRCMHNADQIVYAKDGKDYDAKDYDYTPNEEVFGKSKVKVLTPKDELKDVRNGVFLAGPSTRGDTPIGWREAFIYWFKLRNCDCTILNPENPGYGEFTEEKYRKQTEWEIRAMHMATRIIFWIPRTKEHPALTTNVEFGEWFSNKATYVGYPLCSEHNRYIKMKCEQAGKEPFHRISSLVNTVVNSLEEKPRTYFTSDTHFGSDRTFELSKRPFLNVRDMDLKMASNWNKTVRACDTVYHLGDFGDWGMLQNLNCARLVLVEGNYEKKEGGIPTDKRIEVHDKPMNVKMQNRIYTLVHEPYADYGRNEFYLFGHIHQLQYVKLNGINVGVDCNNFTPVDVATIDFRRDAIKGHYDKNVFCREVGKHE